MVENRLFVLALEGYRPTGSFHPLQSNVAGKIAGELSMTQGLMSDVCAKQSMKGEC